MAEINILYFASLGERLSCNEESFPLESEQLTVGELKQRLSQRGDIWQEQLQANTTRCAVNQDIVNDESHIKANDEVAFFPPVTGG